MPDIPDHSIDMILCDLPYGITQNTWDSVIPLDLLWSQYLRIIKPNGVIALTSSGIFTAKLIISQDHLFKYKWIWAKSKATNFLNAKRQPLRKHEDVCIFYQRQPTYHPQMTQGKPYDNGGRKDQAITAYGAFAPYRSRSNGERCPPDILYFSTPESEGKVYHPSQKPVALGRYLIRTYTNPGDVVLDNACGSGSFLVAALLEGRHYIGIEKNVGVTMYKRDAIDLIDVTKTRLREAHMIVSSTIR
jgi:site-specific DNA-methyltransferase (adenine-specific)/modification methylase